MLKNVSSFSNINSCFFSISKLLYTTTKIVIIIGQLEDIYFVRFNRLRISLNTVNLI